MALLAMSGCAYTVRMSANPSAVRVETQDGREFTTPDIATFRWVPFGRQTVTVSAPGYRTTQIDLRRRVVKFHHFLRSRRKGSDGERTRNEIRFLLVPVHGPAGTWTEDDVE